MGSRSRRPKSSKPNRELLAELLCHGRAIPEPSHQHLEAVELLRSLGLVTNEDERFVRCANPQDKDYARVHVRSCQGRIAIDDELDEAGGDIRCSECDRVVYPRLGKKQQFRELRVWHSLDGIIDYLKELLLAAGWSVDSTDSPAAVRISGDELPRPVLLGVLDYADEASYFFREYAQYNPAFYVVVDSKNLEHQILDESWIQRASLAQLLVEADLVSRIEAVSRGKDPQDVASLRTPLVPKKTKRTRPASAELARDVMVVELGPTGFRVQGVLIGTPRGAGRLPILQVLFTSYLSDLTLGSRPDDYKILSLENLAKEINVLTKDPLLDDLETLRRALTRIRHDVRDQLQAAGYAVDESTIIENFERGYRLNPRRVAVRPWMSD